MTAYKLSEDVIYREVEGELIAIQTSTGMFYYFSKNTKSFFDYMKEPRTFESICSMIRPNETEYYRNFCEMLVTKKIFDVKELSTSPVYDGIFHFEKPVFLREGNKKLDEVASDVVLLTTSTT